jgi:hypothetical protein
MKKYITILISMTILSLLYHEPASGQGFLINQVKTLELRSLESRNYSDIEGNPYYTKEFINSVIFLRDGNYLNQPLRYDMYRDEMEFNKEGIIYWLRKKEIKYIRHGSDMIFVSSEDGDTNKLGFFFLKDEGRYLLFLKKAVLFEPMVPPKGYSETIPEKFSPDDDVIFIRQEGNPASRIRNKQDLMKYFSGNLKALERIKSEKIRADKIEDLHRLISYLNELKE